MTEYVTIDGTKMPIEGQRNLLEMVRQAGIDLPTFCYHSELSIYGACRMCVVEDARGAVFSSCSTPPTPGMEIKTNTPRLMQIRRMMLELLLANHQRDCTTCDKNGRCKLQDLCARFGVDRVRFPSDRSDRSDRSYPVPSIDDSSPAILRNPAKCILCGDCVRVCYERQGVGAIDIAFRGADARVTPAFGRSLAEVNCVNCGQCAALCPTGALTVRPEIDPVWAALRDPRKKVVAQIAPAVRVALGEEFGLPPGEITTGKAVAALKRLGFDQVFDTSFTADLTTLEETDEFLHRLQTGQRLPQFTSCCPAWVTCVEQYYPDKVEQLSSCRSPQQMFGSLLKRFYAPEQGIDPADLFVVSVMPCTAKKFEARRPEFAPDGVRDVDAVITTQELARMIKSAGIMFDRLEEEAFDAPFGFATGSGVIFGYTGGVATAVVREAAATLAGAPFSPHQGRGDGETGRRGDAGTRGRGDAAVLPLPSGEREHALWHVHGGEGRTSPPVSPSPRPAPVLQVELHPVEGLEGVRAAELEIARHDAGGPPRTPVRVRLAVASGLGAARRLVEAIDEGKVDYDIVEVMTCPGGCAGGGGQPTPNETPQRLARAAGLRTADTRQQIRLARDNPLMGELYRKWLDKPNSPIAHEALHTHYGHRRRIEAAGDGHVTPEGAAVEIKVCVGSNCFRKGSRHLLRRFAREMEERGLENLVDLKAAFCLERCDKGPGVTINGREHHHVREDDVPDLLMRAVAGAEIKA